MSQDDQSSYRQRLRGQFGDVSQNLVKAFNIRPLEVAMPEQLRTEQQVEEIAQEIVQGMLELEDTEYESSMLALRADDVLVYTAVAAAIAKIGQEE